MHFAPEQPEGPRQLDSDRPTKDGFTALPLYSCAACAEEYAFEAGVLEEVRRKLRRITVPEPFLQRLTATLARERAGGT